MAAEANPTPARWQESTVASHKVHAGAAGEAVEAGVSSPSASSTSRPGASGISLIIKRIDEDSEPHDLELILSRGSRPRRRAVRPPSVRGSDAPHRVPIQVCRSSIFRPPGLRQRAACLRSDGVEEAERRLTSASEVAGPIPLPATFELARQCRRSGGRGRSVFLHRVLREAESALRAGADGVDRAMVSADWHRPAVDAQGSSGPEPAPAHFLRDPAYMAADKSPARARGHRTPTPTHRRRPLRDGDSPDLPSSPNAAGIHPRED